MNTETALVAVFLFTQVYTELVEVNLFPPLKGDKGGWPDKIVTSLNPSLRREDDNNQFSNNL